MPSILYHLLGSLGLLHLLLLHHVLHLLQMLLHLRGSWLPCAWRQRLRKLLGLRRGLPRACLPSAP